jgi:hypothetical protein
MPDSSNHPSGGNPLRCDNHRSAGADQGPAYIGGGVWRSGLRSSLVQLRTPDEMRGRVGAVNFLFINASNQRSASFWAISGLRYLLPDATECMASISTLGALDFVT